MSNETFVRRCLACIIIAERLRSLTWNLRDDGGQIPPPSPVRAIRDVRTILSAGDIPELVRDDASLFEKYAGAESVFSSIWSASIRIEHAAEAHGLEWSDELRDALRFAIDGFPVETMAYDARRELRSWMEEWIPSERLQPMIDEAEKPIGGGHGLRFTPTGGSGDANAPAEPEESGKLASVNERMAAMVQEDPSLASWTATKWAEKLGVSDAAVRQTHTWKVVIKAGRSMLLADRATRRQP